MHRLKQADEKYKNRESRPEDVQLIQDLQHIVAEKDSELSSLTEEKRFYQLELINRETNYNKLFKSQPVIGVIDPLQYKKKNKISKSVSPVKKVNTTTSSTTGPPLPPKPKPHLITSTYKPGTRSVPLPDKRLFINLKARAQSVDRNESSLSCPAPPPSPEIDFTLEPDPDPNPPQ